MIRFALLLILVSIDGGASAQSDTKPSAQKADTICTTLGQMPEFKGGDSALILFITKNMNLPPLGRHFNVRSNLEVRFVVNVDGSVSDIEVKKSIGPATDAEAIRVLKEMPPFKPGCKNGKPARVYYNLLVPVDWK
jgi:protein TonB